MTNTLHAENTIEFILKVPAGQRSYVSELLWGLPGVDAVMESFQVHEGEVGLKSLSIFTQKADVLGAVKAVLNNDPLIEKWEIHGQQVIEPEDWAEQWKQHWDVTRVTEKLIIRPTWKEYTPQNSDEVVIHLDPGCAFGTGTHPTTQLMLQWLERYSEKNSLANHSILDVGTGSGILAIYSALKGCQHILGLDIDPLSIKAVEENATVNQANHLVHVAITPIEELCQTQYSIILANISEITIRELFEEMTCRLESEGIMVLSGFVEKSIAPLERLFEKNDFKIIDKLQKDGWYALSIQRR